MAASITYNCKQTARYELFVWCDPTLCETIVYTQPPSPMQFRD